MTCSSSTVSHTALGGKVVHMQPTCYIRAEDSITCRCAVLALLLITRVRAPLMCLKNLPCDTYAICMASLQCYTSGSGLKPYPKP